MTFDEFKILLNNEINEFNKAKKDTKDSFSKVYIKDTIPFEFLHAVNTTHCEEVLNKFYERQQRGGFVMGKNTMIIEALRKDYESEKKVSQALRKEIESLKHQIEVKKEEISTLSKSNSKVWNDYHELSDTVRRQEKELLSLYRRLNNDVQ